MIAVLDDLDIDRADVCDTSMGGRVASWLTIRHPSRVRRLVLGATSPGGQHSVERGTDVRRSLAGPDPAKMRQTPFELMSTPT